MCSRLSRRLTSTGRAVWGCSDGRGLRRGMGGMGDENGEGRGGIIQSAPPSSSPSLAL